MDELDEQTKKEIIKNLIKDNEIIMLYDSMNNCYRPLWKNEWDIQQENLAEDVRDFNDQKYAPYIATEDDITDILKNGILEWDTYDNKNWFVKIWW